MSDGDEDPELCFSCGQFLECAKLLELALSSSLPFTRNQWRITANLLACRMQTALVSGNVDQLVLIHSQYLALWERITGLPTSAESLTTELVVTFALCQLEHCLVYRGCYGNRFAIVTLSSACQRLCRYCSMEWVGVPDSLPLLAKGLATSSEDYQTSPESSPFLILLKAVCLAALLDGSLAKRCSLLTAVQRALVFTSRCHGDDPNIVESTKDEKMFELAVKVKYQLDTDPHGVDQLYYRAWSQYSDGQYETALKTLESSSSSSHTTPIINLLRAHCYTNTSKPHLAQCCYLACLSSGSSLVTLPAMASCSLLYRQLSNSQAEMKARVLTVEALQTSGERWSGRGRELLLWLRRDGLHTEPLEHSGREWAESSYHTAMRAMQLNRPDVAARVLQDLVRSIVDDLPPTLPTPSLLNLLFAKALFTCGQYNKSLAVCDKLTSNLANLASADTEDGPLLSVLVLAQALFLGALSSFHLHEAGRANCLTHRSYKVCRYVVSKFDHQQNSQVIASIIKLMVSNLSLLSVVSVAEGNQREALSLVSQASSLSNTLSTTYNHCLLLSKVGKVKDSAHSWLKERGLLPTKRVEARLRVAERKKLLLSLGSERDREKDYVRLDVAMLRTWIRYSPS